MKAGLRVREKRGLAIYLVLCTILLAVILANVVINIILSQTHLTTHQISRIQAHYASLAAMNYALEKLRVGTDANWPIPANPAANYTHHLCRDSSVTQCSTDTSPIIEPDLAAAVSYVQVRVAATGTAGDADYPACSPGSGITCVNSKAIYVSKF